MTQAVEFYNKATGTLETRVLVSARRFKDLEAATPGEDIASILRIEKMTRDIQAKDFEEGYYEIHTNGDAEI